MKYLLCNLGFIICFYWTVYSQNNNAGKKLEQNLKNHISFLADDKLEGRRAGTAGEHKAMQYIANQFKKYNISPKGTDAYYQPFDIYEGKQMAADVKFAINEVVLQPGTDYFIFPFSATKQYASQTTIGVTQNNMPWIINIANIFPERIANPHFDINAALYNYCREAIQKGAGALIFYDTSSPAKPLTFNGKDKSEVLSVPIIYVYKQAAEKHLLQPDKKMSVDLYTHIYEGKRIAHNVIGYINNHAPTTVVLGAHFDHLGYGEDGNSMLRTGEKLIHNGADDNASGTAALLELARLLKTSEAKNNNYLFISFSGEELGLFGSKFFVENPTIDLHTVNYMINMDMVGRLNDSSHALTIGGYGTSPQWATVTHPGITKTFIIKIDSSGSGPSDHTSFYRKDIPVLFYFTGLHADYHKPSDDFDKINYAGEAEIVQNVMQVIKDLDGAPKLSFLKTREVQVSTTSFKVTLGIMPDYTFSDNGVRVDGVPEGRPAAIAGLKTGDVITALGEYVITDMNTYMQALNKFAKGDQTTVTFKRGEEVKQANIIFK